MTYGLCHPVSILPDVSYYKTSSFRISSLPQELRTLLPDFTKHDIEPRDLLHLI
jgi:hypothetical protein